MKRITLSMAFATVGLLGIFGRLGFAQATTRFYAEERKAGAPALRRFCETMLTGALLASASVALLAGLYFTWAPGGSSIYLRCMQLASLLVVVRVVSAVVLEMYRAPERVFTYATAQVVSRYGALILAVALLLWYEASARAVVLATVVVEGLVVLVCLGGFFRRGLITRLRFPWAVVASATTYGTPLTIAGSGSYILQYGDRFLIERFLNVGAVALYAVPYDLIQSFGEVLFGPLRTASMPVIYRIWAQEGPEATSRFGSRLATYVIAVAIPLFTLFWLVSRDLVLLFASSKYASSAALIPYLLPGIALDQLSFLLSWGLRVEKQTILAAVIAAAGGALNVMLNVLLLPRWGLTGAALATTISYAAMAVALYAASHAVLGLHLQYALIGKSVLATFIMAVCVHALGRFGWPPALGILCRGALGAATAATCMFALDRQLRVRVLLWVRPQLASVYAE